MTGKRIWGDAITTIHGETIDNKVAETSRKKYTGSFK